jgi:hypothetical protein
MENMPGKEWQVSAAETATAWGLLVGFFPAYGTELVLEISSPWKLLRFTQCSGRHVIDECGRR